MSLPRTAGARLRAADAWGTPWLAALLAALGIALAILAQALYDGNPAYWLDPLLLYGLAVALWWLALRRWCLVEEQPVLAQPGPVLDRRRRRALIGGLACVLATTSLAPALARTEWPVVAGLAGRLAILRYPLGPANDTNTLMPLGVILWLVGGLLFLWAVAEPLSWPRREQLWDEGALHIRLAPSTLALFAILALAAVLRFRDLAVLPLEMTSDHVEKLLDIRDVLGGLRPVYLPRNAGREPLEFYWVATLIRLGLPFGFLAMKVGMVLVSLVTIPVVHWVGRRGWSVEVGLFAALALALSPWHLQISRAGLRIGFAPLFVALCLGCLVVALESGRRNAWLAVGVSLGAGMYGYSAFRSMAFLVAAAVVLKAGWDLWRLRSRERAVPAGGQATASAAVGWADDGASGQSHGIDGASGQSRAEEGPPGQAHAVEGASGHGNAEAVAPHLAAWRASLGELVGHVAWSGVAALLVAAPLIRFALDQPRTFWGRTITRITGAEVPLEHAPLVQFVTNWRRALLMFNATSDSAWLQSPPGRPALETVTGALLVLGAVAGVQALLRRRWREPLLLLALPAMLLSSTLALAFPNEVPHLARASGALPVTMILVAWPLTIVWQLWRRAFGANGTAAAFVGFTLLFTVAARTTVHRYFVEYRQAYNQATHPTSEGARIARGFLALGGTLDHVYLVGWAHGWDYRAFGAQMGDLTWNGLLWGAAADGSDAVRVADGHVGDPAPKLYFVGGDQAGPNVAYLRQLFPTALVAEHQSATTGKTFWTVYVPGREAEAKSG